MYLIGHRRGNPGSEEAADKQPGEAVIVSGLISQFTTTVTTNPLG